MRACVLALQKREKKVISFDGGSRMFSAIDDTNAFSNLWRGAGCIVSGGQRFARDGAGQELFERRT